MRVSAVSIAAVTLCLAMATAADEERSRAAIRDFNLAVKLLRNARTREDGIQKLQTLAADHAENPVGKKAVELLRDNGVGEAIRVQLVDQKVFHERFEIEEESVLEQAETILTTLQKQYRGIRPFYTSSDLTLLFYDSVARYRKETKLITAAGHFSVRSSPDESERLSGEVVWYFPQQAGSVKDRKTRITSVLYHELTHFLNATHFASTLPPCFEEGIAEFSESRHSTEFRQRFRSTARQDVESQARVALNTISKFSDFETFLDSKRGFGKAGAMLSRWYGLSYSLIDFFDRGSIESRTASVNTLFVKLEARTRELKSLDSLPPTTRSGKLLLSSLVEELYGVDLVTFHGALIEFMQKEYKRL